MKSLHFSSQTQSIDSAPSSHSLADWGICIFILFLGVFQLTHYPHFSDFASDVTYPDLANSLLEHGSYQIRLLPQTTLPPGLPFLLALAGKFFGLSPAVAFGVVAISTTLGLLAAYELLRRVEGRGIAAVTCLLLVSYPPLFGFNTGVVFPEMSYLFVSMAALLLVLQIDRSKRSALLIVWISLLTLALIFTVLIRSVGIALLLGLIAWIAASFFTAPEKGRLRFARFVCPLALGLVAQVSWSTWAQHHQTLEWQLPGYPGSYFSQLRVKDGQHPELGFAKVTDIPTRVERNLVTRTAGFDQILSRRHISNFWSSPAIIGLLIVVAVGLISSLRGGGQLFDWYFLCYECIFMVWPWDYRDRFVFPVVPLACLYVWRGLQSIWNFLVRQPRKAGLAFAVIGSVLCLCSAAFALRLFPFPSNPDHVRGDHLQAIAASLFWGVLAIAGLVIFWLQQSGQDSYTRLVHFGKTVLPIPLRVALILVVTFLVVPGVRNIVSIGRNRSNPDITKQSLYPELEASEWIRTHEPPNLVLMAREPEFVFHYTHDPTVWFPPISDPKALMDGIQRHHVDLVVVAHHLNSYWLPAEGDSFQRLEQSYPTTFRLIHQGPDNSVYEVVASTEKGAL